MYNCRLLHTTLLALLSKDMLPSPVQCSLPQHLSPPTAAFLVPHLSTTRSLPSFPPLHWVSVHPSGTGNCNVSYSIVFFFPKQLYIQIFIALSLWSGSRFLKHHKYWTIAEIQLEYSAVAQSRSDVAA